MTAVLPTRKVEHGVPLAGFEHVPGTDEIQRGVGVYAGPAQRDGLGSETGSRRVRRVSR